jgi:hypothetical protein
MLRLEKSVRAPEYTALKAPASKNLCNVRVNYLKPSSLDGCLAYVAPGMGA